jgi:hypothetical protein
MDGATRRVGQEVFARLVRGIGIHTCEYSVTSFGRTLGTTSVLSFAPGRAAPAAQPHTLFTTQSTVPVP